MHLHPKHSSIQKQRMVWGMCITFIFIPTSLTQFCVQPIVRKPRKFNPLHIPKSLQARLPFKTVPKQEKPRKKPTLASRRVRILEPEEKKRVELLVQLGTLKNEKLRIKKEKMKQKLAEYKKMKAKEEAEKERRQKMNRKRLYRLEGLLSQQPQKKQKVK